MSKQDRKKFSWQRALSILAIGLSTAGAIESAAIARPIRGQNNLKLAQVGVRSRINAPTPLNLTPRTHIPLPASRYNRHHNYYRNGRYKESHYRSLDRGHRHYRGYRNYDRYDRYGYDRNRYEHRHHRRNHRRGSKITIFF